MVLWKCGGSIDRTNVRATASFRIPNICSLLDFSRTNVRFVFFVSYVEVGGGRWGEPNKCSVEGEQKKKKAFRLLSHFVGVEAVALAPLDKLGFGYHCPTTELRNKVCAVNLSCII